MAGARGGFAQCASYASASAFSCSNSSGCNQTIEVDVIETGEYDGAYFVYSPVTCCGVSGYPNFYVQGQCYSAALKDPALRQRLKEIAQQGDFLIATCKGEFVPLTLAVVDPPPPLVERKSTLTL